VLVILEPLGLASSGLEPALRCAVNELCIDLDAAFAKLTGKRYRTLPLTTI
jgi:hypothetical protein